MTTVIKTKNSITTSSAPSSLAQGELAVNIADKKVWIGDASSTPVQLLGAGGSVSFGALTATSITDTGLTSGRVTYAGTSGLLQDSANLTFNGTILTSTGLSGPLNGTVGATTPNTGAFTNLSYTGTLTGSTGIMNIGSGQLYKDASGNLGIGTTTSLVSSTGGSLTVGVGGSSASNHGQIALNGSTASNYGAGILGYSSGTYIWGVGTYGNFAGGTSTFLLCKNTSGGVYLNGASATSWTAVSDETRKVIIEPITDATSKVSTLRAVIGRLKTDDESVRRPYLIAQDVQKVLPEAVAENEDAEGTVLGLSYTEVIPLLVAAIKEQQAIIQSLTARLEALEAK